jgi:hypothetical protein
VDLGCLLARAQRDPHYVQRAALIASTCALVKLPSSDMQEYFERPERDRGVRLLVVVGDEQPVEVDEVVEAGQLPGTWIRRSSVRHPVSRPSSS